MTKNIPPKMKERYEEARRLIESSKDIKTLKFTAIPTATESHQELS